MLGIVKYVLQKFYHFVKFQKNSINQILTNSISVNLKSLLFQLHKLSNDGKDENNDLPNSRYKDREYFSTLSNNMK